MIKKLEELSLKQYNDPKAFIEYSYDMQDVYKNIEDYNLETKRKMLVDDMIFDDIFADMIKNKKN